MDEDQKTLAERVAWHLGQVGGEVRFWANTYPRVLRRYSISVTRPTWRYARRTERAQKSRTVEHQEMFRALETWIWRWRGVLPSADSIRSGCATRLQAWDDVVRPGPGQTNDDLARAFLPGVLRRVSAPSERLILCTSSWSYADGTRPKPLREFKFLDQAYWCSVSEIDSPGECQLTHVFASVIEANEATLEQATKVVVDTEARGVFVMPTDMRWVTYLYYAGIDVMAKSAEDIAGFEQAALDVGGRPAP